MHLITRVCDEYGEPPLSLGIKEPATGVKAMSVNQIVEISVEMNIYDHQTILYGRSILQPIQQQYELHTHGSITRRS